MQHDISRFRLDRAVFCRLSSTSAPKAQVLKCVFLEADNVGECDRTIARGDARLRKTEEALRNLRQEESCERDPPGEQETKGDGRWKWQVAHGGTFARIVPVRAPGHVPRRLSLRLLSPGRPERVLRVHEVYCAELAGGKEIANFGTVEGGCNRQTCVAPFASSMLTLIAYSAHASKTKFTCLNHDRAAELSSLIGWIIGSSRPWVRVAAPPRPDAPTPRASAIERRMVRFVVTWS